MGSRLSTVSVPADMEDLFSAAESVVSRYFQQRNDDPVRGTIEISGERYVLLRAASLSVEFFALVRELYGSGRDAEADEFARNILFDLAHAIGKKDAKSFHTKMGLTDPIARLSAGPVHFAHAGWAKVKIFPESRPSPDENCYIAYEHPYSFEADAWLGAGERRHFPVCIMSAGYSSGWCEESFGIELVSAEVRCRARGDDSCRFVMAPPHRIEDYVKDEGPPGTSIIPDFFARKRAEEELRRTHGELERRVEERTADLKRELEERRRIEEQLHRQNKLEALGRLAGGVAHDFNNLMAVVLTNGALLERTLDKDDSRRAYTEEMINAVHRAADLTRQLLAFGRATLKAPESIEVDVVVSDLSRMLVRLIGDDVELAIGLGSERARVFISRSELEQVVVNLVVNARDALPTGGTISMSTSIDPSGGPDQERVVLRVTDSGVGMTPDTQSSIFDPFFTTKGTKGTGLGLSTVYGIVQRAGGSITVESDPGEGASFVVCLPRSRLENKAPSSRSPIVAPAPGNGELILVVEDQPSLREALRQSLIELGYLPVAAADPREALAIARGGSPPLVLLTDVMMPLQSGIELADRVEAELPEVQVIFMSANPSEALDERRASGRVVRFMAKPFTLEALGRVVSEALASRR